MHTLTNAVVFTNFSLHGGGHDDWGGQWWIWRLGMFLIWILFIGLALWWFRRRGCGCGGQHDISGVERARGILAERYARGEIDAKEYHERLGHLR